MNNNNQYNGYNPTQYGGQQPQHINNNNNNNIYGGYNPNYNPNQLKQSYPQQFQNPQFGGYVPQQQFPPQQPFQPQPQQFGGYNPQIQKPQQPFQPQQPQPQQYGGYNPQIQQNQQFYYPQQPQIQQTHIQKQQKINKGPIKQTKTIYNPQKNEYITTTKTKIKVSNDPTSIYYSPFIAKKPKVLNIKEKFFTLKNDMNIYDAETNEKIFIVKGSFLSLGINLKILNLNGNEVAKVTSKVFSLMPTFYIYQNGKKVAKIEKKLTFFSDKFSFDLLETPGIDFVVEGNCFGHNYKIKRGKNVVATISKKFALTDQYQCRIETGENYLLVLGCCIIIDKYLDQRKSSGS